MKYLALDSHGRPLARLETEDYARAVRFVLLERAVPGAVNVIGDNAYSDGDIKMTEARLIAAFQASGLSEAEAKIAARGRERDLPTRDFLPIIHVPRDDANTTPRSSSTVRISERESQEREGRALELREPTRTDHASGLTEFEEPGTFIREDGLTELVASFRGLGLSEAEAKIAALGRDNPVGSSIREAGQQLGVPPPPAYAQLLPYADGTAQWRIPTCPLCAQRHFIPEQPTTDDLQAMVDEPMAMPCRKGVAVLTDSATNPPPDPANLHKVANPDTLGANEEARAEADLVSSFRGLGLSEAEARIAARGRDLR